MDYVSLQPHRPGMNSVYIVFSLDNDPSFFVVCVFSKKSILFFCTIVQAGMVGECVAERCVACRIFRE